jgi:hypothetical protein
VVAGFGDLLEFGGIFGLRRLEAFGVLHNMIQSRNGELVVQDCDRNG